MAKKLIRIEFSRVSVLRREKRKHLNFKISYQREISSLNSHGEPSQETPYEGSESLID